MTTNTVTAPSIKKDAGEAIKSRQKEMRVLNTVIFDDVSLNYIQKVSEAIQKDAGNSSITAPLFSHFIGENAVSLIVDNNFERFVIKREGLVVSAPVVIGGAKVTGIPNGQEPEELKDLYISFSEKRGKDIITFLTVILPFFNKKYAESIEFQSLQQMNLKGRLVAKARKKAGKERETILVAAVTMADIYVVSDGKVLGLLTDIPEEDIAGKILQASNVDGETQWVAMDGIEFYVAKDTRLEQLNSASTLWQKSTGSLSMFRLAKIKKKKAQVIEVVKSHSLNGMTITLKDSQTAVVMDEMLSIDGNGLKFGDLTGAVSKAVFSKINILHRENGELELESDVSEEEATIYKAYMKSTSMARSSGAVGFKNREDVVSYYLGTGQDEMAYTKQHKDKNKVPTGFNVMSVDKAYKRFMLGMSNGRKAETGLLSRFNGGIQVKYVPAGERNVIGDIKPAYVIVTNRRGEKITIAMIEDFTAEIQREQKFLVNKLDENNAFIGVEQFTQWDNKDAVAKLLIRNLTDGSGWYRRRIGVAARTAGILNSFDAFQLRISNAVKGAVHEHEEMCDLLNADIVLTEGMVKSENIVQDIIKNGLQMFVVGQRKDSTNGAWIASQATQQFGMTREEMISVINQTVDFTQKAIDDKFASDLLTLVNATEEESESEFVAIDYLRLAEEFGDILDEQYIRDEIVSLSVKKMNKLLDSKFFIETARNRYMFTDPIALYNAAKDGRYRVTTEDAVLKAYEIVAPSKGDNGFFMELGEAVSVRFPMTVSHEAALVVGVAPAEYLPYVQAGLWQGCTFFDAVSWVVAEQAGADHDGDASAIIFDKTVVKALRRMKQTMFAGNQILPLIDAYVKYRDGESVEFDMGCPTYNPSGDELEEDVMKMKQINGFYVQGYDIYTTPWEFKSNGEKRRREFLELVAEMSHKITVNTIETSLIGVIANRAMILTDLLSRTDKNGYSLLSKSERFEVETDLINLCVAGRWEIDRPKHGGAYMQMPLMQELFAKFEAIQLSKDEMELTEKAKYSILAEKKAHYAHIFGPVQQDFKIKGFRVVKPHWLASQKDEKGPVNEGSLFEDVLKHANSSLKAFCDKYQVGHSNTAKNEMRTRIGLHMELSLEDEAKAEFYVRGLYNAYTAQENARSAAERQFKAEKEIELREAGKFAKKNMKSMTSAKKTAKIRKEYKLQLSQFSTDRDLFKAQFRKSMYVLAKDLGLDVRALVGSLYLIINAQKTSGTASHTMDGREYRFVPSNGYISIPFEVFQEEMSSLISGRISDTYFIPLDTAFTMLTSSLANATATTVTGWSVRANVFAPTESNANTTVYPNRPIQVAVRPEEIRGEMRLLAYFLKGSSQVQDAMMVTREESLFAGIAPENFPIGMYTMHVNQIDFEETGAVATIRFQ